MRVAFVIALVLVATFATVSATELEQAPAPNPRCHSVCSWACDQPTCPATCHPVCERPRCQMQCEETTCAKCTIHCEKPVCSVRCPKEMCEMESCPKCETVCSPSVCHTTCLAPEPVCSPVCEPTRCDWKCKKPEVCPKPKCSLNCPRSRCPVGTNTAIPLARFQETKCCKCSEPGNARLAMDKAGPAPDNAPNFLEVISSLMHQEQLGESEQCCPCA
jgi:hypothetical protein